MRTPPIRDFVAWRDLARKLIERNVSPDGVQWIDGRSPQTSLGFDDSDDDLGVDGDARSESGNENDSPRSKRLVMPPDFLDLCRYVACHRDPRRWDLLYRLLARVAHGERHLLELHADDEVRRAVEMQKAVRRDAHKMKAFVRFVEVRSNDSAEPSEPNRDSGNLHYGDVHYVAWHATDHYVASLTAPFFAERFSAMRWMILGPDESVAWDGQRLTFGPGVPRDQAPPDDELTDLWLTYYGSIFNPARIKLAAMKSEMPMKRWSTLPETRILPELLAAAPARVEAMRRHQEGWAKSAAEFLPPDETLKKLSPPEALSALREAAANCEGCALCGPATQTVFGEGPANARIILIGEQPGDEEDLAGRPFVGPAGRTLNDLLNEAGVDRSQVYVTNAVKHFKYVQRGKRRLHQNPNRAEVLSCRAWLEQESAIVQPAALVCLGSTAATSIFGPAFRIAKSRGQPLASEFCPRTIATYHPSVLLRLPDRDAAEARRREIVADLALARHLAS